MQPGAGVCGGRAPRLLRLAVVASLTALAAGVRAPPRLPRPAALAPVARRLLRGGAEVEAEPAATSFVGQRGPENTTVDVVERQSIESTKLVDCLCELGYFWHLHTKECVKQGGWGYECGFFPGENHQQVCQDGLSCQPTPGGGPSAPGYVHEGAQPATCLPCRPQDDCQEGKERHEERCLKEYKVSGEACATVRVSAMVAGKGEATRSHTATVTSYSRATGEASAEATAKANSTQQATANASATATASATTSAEESKHAEATVNGTKPSNATAEEPVGEADATAKATEEATSTRNATVTSKASATASANASANATVKLEVNHSADVEHTANASATASAQVEAVVEARACVDIATIRERLGLRSLPRMGPVLAAHIVSMGDSAAFEKAYAEALEEALRAGAVSAKEAAEALAGKRAAEEARLKAEAAARNRSAWAAEAGAQDAADQQAVEAAKEKAKAEATEKAVAKAEKKAKEAAMEEAKKKAAQKAKKAAEEAAQKAADAKADESAHAAAAVDAAFEAEAKAKEEAVKKAEAAEKKEEKEEKKEEKPEPKPEDPKKAAEEKEKAQQAIADLVTPKAEEPTIKVPAEPTEPPLRKMAPEDALP